MPQWISSTQIRGDSSGGSDDQDQHGMIVEPPTTVDLCLCSSGFMMTRSIFSSLCWSERVETWLVRPANESDCTMTDFFLVTCLQTKIVVKSHD